MSRRQFGDTSISRDHHSNKQRSSVQDQQVAALVEFGLISERDRRPRRREIDRAAERSANIDSYLKKSK
jgi:hypothetical protein